MMTPKGVTLARYSTRFRFPIKYAINAEAVEDRGVPVNEYTRTGMGAIQTRGLIPSTPVEKKYNRPDETAQRMKVAILRIVCLSGISGGYF
jgi:hypothetical protein